MMVMMTVVVWWGDSGVVVRVVTSMVMVVMIIVVAHKDDGCSDDDDIDGNGICVGVEGAACEAGKVFKWPATAAVVVEGWPAVAGQIEGEREVIVMGELEYDVLKLCDEYEGIWRLDKQGGRFWKGFEAAARIKPQGDDVA
ncbi:hypothetical protein Tco_0834317 [Tanacetum coccineum]